MNRQRDLIGNAAVNRIQPHSDQAGQKRGPANRQREVLVDSVEPLPSSLRRATVTAD